MSEENTKSAEPTPPLTKELVLEALIPVQDPEIRIGVVDLGLIYDVDISDKADVTVKMTLTTPACPYAEILIGSVKKAVSDLPGVSSSEVEMVWDPPWDPREMASDMAKDQLGIW